MEAGRIIIAGIAFTISAAGVAGDVIFVRPGPCTAQETYLLAANSAAIIRIDDADETNGVIVFREQPQKGWASRHLLRRFDLSLGDTEPTIINSGEFCRRSQ